MRLRGCILVLLLFVSVSGSWVHAAGQVDVEVFFVPEQGYIRVNSSFPMPGDLTVAEFTLFPNAQITALWIPGLAAYEVDRVGTGTVVLIRMAPTQPGEILEISYEGFLPNYDLLPDKTLNRRLQWFPEFSGADTGTYRVKLTLPQAYVPKMQGELVEERQSTFATYTWILANQDYPVIWFDGSEVPDSPTAEPEPETPEPEPPAVPQDEEEDPAEPQKEIPPGLTDAFAIFTEAYASLDRGNLESLLDPDFPDRKEFFVYLANRPEPEHQITSLITDVTLEQASAAIYAEFYDGPALQSKALMYWHKPAEIWLLQSLIQIPAGYDFLEQISDPALQQWIGALADAMAALDLAWLNYYLAGARSAAISFLEQAHNRLEWRAVAVDAEHHSIVFLVQTEDGLSLRLVLGYIPQGSTWRVKSFAAIPSADKE